MAKMQEHLIKKKPIIKPLDFSAEEIIHLFGKKPAEEARNAYQIKAARIIENSRLRRNDEWESIAGRIEAITTPSSRIDAILKAAECPDTPEKLGWSSKAHAAAITYARFLRDRFTFLDLQS